MRFLTSLTLGAMLAGYGVGTLVVPARCGAVRYLAGSAALGIVLCLVAACLQGAGSVACIALLGLANAMMMPIVFPLVLHAAGTGRTGRRPCWSWPFPAGRSCRRSLRC
ncbi:hypothetical protein RAA17_09745 [Komagataeibacter rhaeticus]|nr:hypothetical protein [Komagataeibacter rhaeticus]